MYTMLLEEINWALEENEPYDFSHYIIVSKTYEEIESQLDMEESRPQKKRKKSDQTGAERFYFHPEDEKFERHAMCSGSFEYTRQYDEGHSDSKRAFQEAGIRPVGSLIVIDKSKFEAAVNDVAEYLKPPV